MRFCQAVSFVLFLSLTLAACGQTSPECPIAGTVKVNGKPADGVYVMFHRTSTPGDAAVASAKSSTDGTFVCSVPEAGDYAVTLLWPKVTVTKEETIEGDDRFRGKYSTPQNAVASVTAVTGQTTTADIAVTTR